MQEHKMLGQTQTTPDLVSKATAYRVFDLSAKKPQVDILTGPSSNSVWTKGENSSVCNWDITSPHHQTDEFEKCSCGFYGFHSLEKLKNHYINNPVISVTKHWGDVTVYEDGLRSQYAEITAVTVNPDKKSHLYSFLIKKSIKNNQISKFRYFSMFLTIYFSPFILSMLCLSLFNFLPEYMVINSIPISIIISFIVYSFIIDTMYFRNKKRIKRIAEQYNIGYCNNIKELNQHHSVSLEKLTLPK